MRVTLASGSGGNATLVQAGGTRVLIDAGIGPEIVRARMERVFGRVLEVNALLAIDARDRSVREL